MLTTVVLVLAGLLFGPGAASARAADLPGQSPATMLREVRALLSAPETKDTDGRIEALLDALQRTEDVPNEPVLLDGQFDAHGRMLDRYARQGFQVGIRKHALWIVNAENRVRPDSRAFVEDRPRAGRVDDVESRRHLRQKHRDVLVAGFLALARVTAADGDTAQAVTWLERGQRDLSDVSGARQTFAQEIERLKRSRRRWAP